MTHIRSALVAGLLVFGGALAASAQQPAQAGTPQPQQQGQQAAGHRRMGPGRRGDPSLKGIALSATEKANVKAVRAKYASQLKALRSQGKTSDSRAQAMKIMQAERADMRGALSAENQSKFDTNVAQMKQRKGKRG